MSRPAAQTALSDGFGPAWADFADVVDIASLDRARSRYLRRKAMDAVDHLIALLDALDAETEDREPDQDGGEDDDCDAEDDGTAEPSLAAPERHPEPPGPGYTALVGRYVDRSTDARQIGWAAGGSSDREEEHDGCEPDEDREDDGLYRGEGDDSDAEPSLGASNPSFGFGGASVSQVAWALGSSDTDREHDPADGEPYLSVVEFDGHGDNWGRSGHGTSGWGTDVEAVNEDGDPGKLPWWDNPTHPAPDLALAR